MSPTTGDHYEFLGVPKDASQEQIKLAYRKKALQFHPDRAAAEDKEAAKEKFQQLGYVYGILSNPRLRDIYDKTGSVANEEFADFGEREWDEYFRQMYPKISKDAIKEFEQKYKGSEEELTDLKEAYVVAKGDMGQIIDTVILASVEDEERFRSLLLPLVESKELPSFKAFVKDDTKKAKQRRVKAEKEAKEAEEHAKELGLGKVDDASALTALIQGRRENNFDAMISRLEDKYKGTEKKASKRAKAESTEAAVDDEPPKKRARTKRVQEEEVKDDEEESEEGEEESGPSKRKKKSSATKKQPAKKSQTAPKKKKLSSSKD